MNLAKQIMSVYYTQDNEKFEDNIYKLDKFEYTNKSKFVDYEKMYSCILYKDFSQKELKIIFNYFSSDTGKEETKLIYNAFNKYIKVFIKDIMKKITRIHIKK